MKMIPQQPREGDRDRRPCRQLRVMKRPGPSTDDDGDDATTTRPEKERINKANRKVTDSAIIMRAARQIENLADGNKQLKFASNPISRRSSETVPEMEILFYDTEGAGFILFIKSPDFGWLLDFDSVMMRDLFFFFFFFSSSRTHSPINRMMIILLPSYNLTYPRPFIIRELFVSLRGCVSASSAQPIPDVTSLPMCL